MRVIYAIIVVVIILILYNIATWNVSNYEDYLYGFWVADDDFCEEAEIESMLIFIGEPDSGWSQTRTCYIIIMNDMSNQGFTLSYNRGWAGIGVGKYRLRASAEFDSDDLWSEQVTIDVDMRDGTMRIYDGDTTYARLTKQNETTNLARSGADVDLVEN